MSNRKYEALTQALHHALECEYLRISVVDLIIENLDVCLKGLDRHLEEFPEADGDRAREIRAQRDEIADFYASLSKNCQGMYADEE